MPKTGILKRVGNNKTFMKNIFGIVFVSLLLFYQTIQAQVTGEVIAMDPQSGSHNYFGVKVTLSQTYGHNVTVTGYICDEGNGFNANHPFTLTVLTGELTAETAANFYETDPTASATIYNLGIVYGYAGVSITYEPGDCILKFNSAADVNTVINQLNADYDSYNDDYDSQYPNLTEEQLDDMDEQNEFDEFQKFKDFENIFGGFCSKRAEIENLENTWLDNNFTGTDPDDIDLTFDDAENTIFNNTYSFKIGNDVYQLTSTGVYINGVYQEDGGNSRIMNKANDIMYAGSNFYNWGHTSGPMVLINNDKNVTFGSNCKTNKKLRSPLLPLPGTNRQVRLKVAIHTIGIMHSIKGKVVHFKIKNGKPKRARAKMAVRVDGLVRNVVCDLIDPVAKNDPYTVGTFKKRRELRARVSHVGGPIWRTFQGDVVASFTMQEGYNDSLPLQW
jgi:hypothetical protein